MSIAEKIKEFEDELKKTKYNKATQKHIGLVKAKIAKLKADQEVQSSKKGATPSYATKKQGNATTILVGFPSVGKSTLLNAITNAESKVGEYEFTTLKVIPGMLEYNGAKIQVLDVPGLISGAAHGKGRGREILSVLRNADLIITLVDKPGQLQTIRKELYITGLRLDRQPPKITIKKKNLGGIHITSTVKQPLEEEYIKNIINEFGIHNADVILKQTVTEDDLIDTLSRNRKYVPSLVVLNKIDTIKNAGELKQEIGNCISISAEDQTGLEELRQAIFDKLRFMRVFMKKIGKEPDLKEPMIAKRGTTVIQLCEKICREWKPKFKYGKVWGPSSKFDGQTVGPDHILKDGAILEFHLNR